MKQYDIITIFPEILSSYFNESLFKRGQKNKLIKIKTHNLRNWTSDRHQTVDGRPYGGGVGLVFKAEPVIKALKSIRKKKNYKTILLSPTGKKFNQQLAKKLSSYDQLIFICPRYEGIDGRIEKIVDEKISIGDYVLTGGELPAAVIIDAVSRFIPSFVGKEESVKNDSFSQKDYLEHQQYTRPEVIEYYGKKMRVPKVLLSGNHKNIEKWREKHSKSRKT